jgi:hypothetical protein
MDESLELLLKVVEVLEDLGVSYHVGGSFASSVHGNPRQTRDADVVADLPASAVPTFVSRLQDEFYLDADRIVQAIQRRSSFNLIHLTTGFKIDIFLLGTGAFDRSEFARHGLQRLVDDLPREFLVKSAEDTILRKLQWYRLGGQSSDRQWLDVLGILRAQGERLDRSYLRHWARDLGVENLLEQALGESEPS